MVNIGKVIIYLSSCNLTKLYGILIEKALEKLYELLKNQNMLPDESNIKILWAEQLRKIKFEDWVEKNF